MIDPETITILKAVFRGKIDTEHTGRIFNIMETALRERDEAQPDDPLLPRLKELLAAIDQDAT